MTYLMMEIATYVGGGGGGGKKKLPTYLPT
jgi:hypothetical protein